MSRTKGLIWLNLALVIVAWLLAFWIYDGLPERFPAHFDLKGEPDRWTDKNPFEFFLLPSVSTLIITLILILLRYPEYYNFPQKMEVREWPREYSQPVYEYLKQAVLTIGVLLSLMFIYIQCMINETAHSTRLNNSNIWVMIAITAIWLPITIYFVLQISKIVKKQRFKLENDGK